MRWTGMPMAMWVVFARSFQTQLTAVPVSYTHLDVYKRQVLYI